MPHWFPTKVFRSFIYPCLFSGASCLHNSHATAWMLIFRIQETDETQRAEAGSAMEPGRVETNTPLKVQGRQVEAAELAP